VAKVTLSVSLLVCVALAACGGDGNDGGAGGGGDKTFQGDGYSFTYPGDWDELEGGEPSGQVGEPVSRALFGPSAGSDAMEIEVYRLNLSVTEDNLDELSGEIARVAEELFRQADGEIASGPTRVTVGGLPGFSFEGSAVDSLGVRVQAWLTFAFDRRTEYFVDCEFTPEGAEEMKQGCDQVLESFQVEQGAP
jgi:hypothetical protein